VVQNVAINIIWKKEMRKQITILKILTSLTAGILFLELVQVFV